MGDEDEEQSYNDSLDTIEESLGEKGMPKFTPPVPINHKELWVQNLDSSKENTSNPTINSTVELQYSGWVSEEGELWRSTNDLANYLRLKTPLLVNGKDSSDPASAFQDSMTRSEMPWCQFFRNRSDPDTERVYVSRKSIKSEGGKALSERFGTSAPCTPPSPSTDQLKPGLLNQDSMSYTAKSTLYGKCFDHTESWDVTLGAGEIVEGLEMVILNMSEGDEVIAFIPSHLAYGEQGLGQMIPPGADLIVQVSLLTIK